MGYRVVLKDAGGKVLYLSAGKAVPVPAQGSYYAHPSGAKRAAASFQLREPTVEVLRIEKWKFGPYAEEKPKC